VADCAAGGLQTGESRTKTVGVGLERGRQRREGEEKMTGYVVHCSRAHRLPRQIGRAFQTLAEAEAAARKAGAIGNGERSGRDLVFDVEGHEGESGYGIWIELPAAAESRLGRDR
jgi:hypothetical protein